MENSGRRQFRRKETIRYVKKGSKPKTEEQKTIAKVETMTPIKVSDEEGFIGGPKSWFIDEEFNKQYVGTFDYKSIADSYFGSYSHFSIHQGMLKDEVRTKSYMVACLNNKEQFQGKIVLDIGCGTGILSMFAARAGAKHVYGVDNATIADFVSLNKINNRLHTL